MNRHTLLAAIAFLAAAPAARAETDAEILLRRYDGGYQAVRPGGAGGYYTREDESTGTYSGVYDRSGRRLGTVKSDAGGTRFYDNHGTRR